MNLRALSARIDKLRAMQGEAKAWSHVVEMVHPDGGPNPGGVRYRASRGTNSYASLAELLDTEELEGGFALVPVFENAEAWSAIAEELQAKLKADVRL